MAADPACILTSQLPPRASRPEHPVFSAQASCHLFFLIHSGIQRDSVTVQAGAHPCKKTESLGNSLATKAPSVGTRITTADGKSTGCRDRPLGLLCSRCRGPSCEALTAREDDPSHPAPLRACLLGRASPGPHQPPLPIPSLRHFEFCTQYVSRNPTRGLYTPWLTIMELSWGALSATPSLIPLDVHEDRAHLRVSAGTTACLSSAESGANAPQICICFDPVPPEEVSGR